MKTHLGFKCFESMVPVHESVSGGRCVEITSSFWAGNWDLQLKMIKTVIINM